ncbi:ATP-binding protein [Bdellovibrio sp. HCB337]|uniref:ATP-binding protein n=1 Tax=Bdellovibrio sp. HCB337 TaxID=3394358 RepID=UPI0039A75579
MGRLIISSTGKKLLTLTLLFSSLITLIVTVIQLYVDFNNEVDHLDKRFHEINDVLSESLTASTWAFDQNQIQKQLKGILRFEQVAKVHLAVEGFRDFEFANNVAPDGPKKTLPLNYVDARGSHDIGLLTVTFTMEQIYGGLIQRGMIMLLSNFLKTLLVSFFILYIFNRLITKPFRDLAARAREASIAQAGLIQPQDLEGRPASSRGHNEIDEMAKSIALMHRNFQGSYQALKMSENRFRDIIADNFDYVFETNIDGEYTFVSSNAAETDPLKKLVVVGQSLFQLPLEEDLKEALKAQAKIQDYALPFPRGSERHHYNLNINPVYDLDNKFVGYRGLLTEVTETVLSKERIEKQEDQIRHIQKVGLIGELAAGFAHDFNNILAIILGNVAILNRVVTPENPTVTKAVTGIQSATVRGQNLIQRILTFARRQGIETKPVDLAFVITAMSELIQVAASKRTKVNLDVPKNLWQVRVDVSSFENVLINLAINARDAMPEGGDLTIGLANKTLTENTDFCVAGDYVTITVTDTGIGIPEEMHEKIFEPFFTTKEEGQGTGLGLSTVLNFVQQSYGAVTVDSNVGRGTSFTIYLPRYQESAS